MARVSILNTRTMDFGELIGNGKTYRVPPYQRDYSWTEEQWEDLWTDLAELRVRPDDSHYLGAIMLEAVDDRSFLIIDGQQRIATLSLLALAVIARIGAIADSGRDAVDNRTRAQELRRAFIGERDPASLRESSKLFLNETDDGFYQDYLVQLRSPINPRRLPRSNKLMWDCFQYFAKRLEQFDVRDDGEGLARFLSTCVSRQLLFIVISIDDELNAYAVFETLNARRLDLTTTDLLKNYLFSRVRADADLDALRRKWKALVGTVGAEQFPEFLRYDLQTVEARVRTQRLYKTVRDRVQTGEQVFALIDRLEARAELFAALSDPDHGYWQDRPEARPFIRELVLFRVRQMTPVLFAAFETFDRTAFVSVLRLVSVLLFRYTVISDLNPNALELPFHRAAKGILDGTLPTPASVAAVLDPVFVADSKFEEALGVLTMDTRGARKRVAKYVLAKLESAVSGRSVDFETDPGTIEHILPENPASDWDESFTVQQQDAYAYRLGNITLLELSKNRAVANGPYHEKLDAYRVSGYALAREVSEIAPAEWTPAFIEKRQRALAKRAVAIWRIDCS